MNNPIEKRFQELVVKWSGAIQTKDVKVVRIHAQHDESVFVRDFFQYMLAIDSNQEDLVFLMMSPWSENATFSEVLLEELEETIDLWNAADKPASLSTEKIEWKPDYSIGEERNKAALFAKNINALANHIVPEKETIVSFILTMPFAHVKRANDWLEDLVVAGLEDHVRIGIADADTNPIFERLATSLRKEVFTLYPRIDMDGAMEEVAALGNPNDPETGYRKHLAKLMNGVKDRDEKKVKINSRKCLDIASKNVAKDTNWLGQVALIYTTLYNDQIGYKDYKRAYFFADKAVEAGTLSIGRVEPATAYRVLGQTLLGRGTIAKLLNEEEKAAEDYFMAITCYERCNDHMMQIESIRLFADEAENSPRRDEVLPQLVNAFNLIDHIPPATITQSTIPWVMKKLIEWPKRELEVSDYALKEKLTPIFGDPYFEKIYQFGKRNHSREVALQDVTKE
jgi:hypothetical protein